MGVSAARVYQMMLLQMIKNSGLQFRQDSIHRIKIESAAEFQEQNYKYKPEIKSPFYEMKLQKSVLSEYRLLRLELKILKICF